MSLALFALALWQGAPAPDPVVLSAQPAILFDNYFTDFPSDCAGVPPEQKCSHTLVGIYYPEDMGPAALGYSNPPAPVFINLRGGNSNPAVPELLGWFQTNVLPRGFVGVDPNFPVVDVGEGYQKAELGIGRLMQYLRHHAEWLNIDPDRIFVFGRSFGGFLSMAVGLREDQQDLTSPDPLRWQSTRPNYLLPYSAPTDLSCLSVDAALYAFLFASWFPISMSGTGTLEQKLADSPVHWLSNPELYGRTVTPPMFLGYHMGVYHPCGEIIDPHDGYMGEWMRQRIDAFVIERNLPQLGLDSVLLDTQDIWGYTAKMEKALDWCVAQLQQKPVMMYQPKPWDPVTPQGSVQSVRALGAVPFVPVHFFFAFHSGPIALPWCPLITEGLPQAFYLGSAFADAEGRAHLDVFVPPVAIGIPLVFHVADLVNCRVTQVLAHTWTK